MGFVRRKVFLKLRMEMRNGHEMEDLKRWIEDRMWRAEYPEFAKA